MSDSALDHALAAANERLLVRLGFDLHDGPLQQVYVLAQDVRLLREQVVRLLDEESRKPVLGCFADFESQLAELHRDLHDLAHSLVPRSLLEEPLPGAVARELAVFERRTEVSTSLTLDGSFDGLTDSQRIALLRVLQEALSNVRQHSGARSVGVSVAADGDGTRLEIRDDGLGFDAPDHAGGLGLAGMRERLRLLGGGLEVTSGAGDGTTLVATLPRWRQPASSANNPLARKR
ncbi:MAG: hypothetical protein H0V68_07060 [Actinobacteria bacterium]|nr:hypothetical protein [Actinomycetota bacterium]